MDRFSNRRILLAKLQTAHNVDPVPTKEDDAILVYDLAHRPLVADKKDRKPLRPFYGSKAALLANQRIEISFKVDFCGSGAAGTPPPYGRFLRACATAEVITAGVKVDYLPIIDDQEEIAFYYNDDGVLYKAINGKGEGKVRLLSNDWPQLEFSFIAMKAGRAVLPVSDDADFSAWIDPLIVNDTNTGDLTLGGTGYPSKGLEFSFGNQVAFKPKLGKETIRVTDRNPTGRFSLDTTPTQEIALLAQIEASATMSLALTHGIAAGNIVEVSGPGVQLVDPTEEDDGGDFMHGYTADFKPVGGNDEFKITVR